MWEKNAPNQYKWSNTNTGSPQNESNCIFCSFNVSIGSPNTIF